MYLTEYHHHTDHSFDSKAVMREVCEQAVLKGIKEICFTDHYSVNPVAPTYGHMDFTSYFSQIEACRQAFHGELIIKAGIELCEPHLNTAEYDQELKGLELDFIMGSVHNINNKKLRTYMSHKEHHEIYLGYFEEVYALVSNADIDVLAHLDLMKRYAMEAVGNYLLADFQEIIDAILTKAIDRGIGIEINTSGVSNKKVGETFPSIDVLKLYKSLGGEILTIGSDSHRATTVGDYLKDALTLAKEAGFDYVYTFDSRKPKAIEIQI